MAEDHVITAAEAAAAKAQPVIPAQYHRPEPLFAADWFSEEVRRRLIDKFGADTTTQGGLVVRTSMDPVLQETAERVLRGGLMQWDHRNGGWRGPVGHVAGPVDLRGGGWSGALGQAARPEGMLRQWRLALVLEETDSEARVGWLETGGEARTGTLSLADLAWARPVHDGRMGGSPRRVSEVARPGDLIMIEPATQSATDAAIAGRPAPAVTRADRVYLEQIPKVEGAMVTIDPTTGRVLSLVGGWSFEQSQFNRATQAVRQPGSSFKPFVYLTALEQGISPSQTFSNSPLTITTNGETWEPQNDDGSTTGALSMHTALQHSVNLVTIRIAQQVTMEAIAQNALAFHITETMHRVLPEAIGAIGTTVLRMAGAYASLAAGGREVVPTLIDSVQDRDGHVVMRAPGIECDGCGNPSAPPVLVDTRKEIADPQSVFQIVTMMRGVVEHGTGILAAKGMGRQVAGKTGTTQDNVDVWFGGFTPDLVTVVWMGFDEPKSLGAHSEGGGLAAPLWHDFMTIALKTHPVLPFVAPEGVTLATWGGGNIDAFKTGQVPGASGPLDGGAGGGGGGTAVSSSGGRVDSGGAEAHGGVDSNLGGLY
jgi:penicillin-binding protein 1A